MTDDTAEHKTALKELFQSIEPIPGPSRQELGEALAQLRKSERGQQALDDFQCLLQNGGTGLDGQNWEALGVIVSACRSDMSDEFSSILRPEHIAN